MRLIGTGEFLIINYPMLLFHSQFMEGRLATLHTQLSLTDMDMDIEPIRKAGFHFLSFKQPAVKVFGSKYNGTQLLTTA